MIPAVEENDVLPISRMVNLPRRADFSPRADRQAHSHQEFAGGAIPYFFHVTKAAPGF